MIQMVYSIAEYISSDPLRATLAPVLQKNILIQHVHAQDKQNVHIWSALQILYLEIILTL